MPIFFTKNGELTSYALACGYVKEWHLTRNDVKIVRVSLWREHNAYHVRSHNLATSTRIKWESFYTLNEARREFCAQKREVRK